MDVKANANFRNCRADLAKWQTADPLGYPDGWGRFVYCGNMKMDVVKNGYGDVLYLDIQFVKVSCLVHMKVVTE